MEGVGFPKPESVENLGTAKNINEKACKGKKFYAIINPSGRNSQQVPMSARRAARAV
jgi:hypothetical protein